VLAVEELNTAGGVLNKKLKLITEDNQSKAGESTNAVNKLIAKDGVVAVLGEVASSRSLEAARSASRIRSADFPEFHKSEGHRNGRFHLPRLLH
jgi:branched-chain amino acid transport system substrate-binding protein